MKEVAIFQNPKFSNQTLSHCYLKILKILTQFTISSPLLSTTLFGSTLCQLWATLESGTKELARERKKFTPLTHSVL